MYMEKRSRISGITYIIIISVITVVSFIAILQGAGINFG